MEYIKSFIIGGIICAAGQLLIDKTRLTSARIMVFYVLAGILLTGVGVYGSFAAWAGAGATVPIIGFGYTLAKGVKTAVETHGLIGVFTGGIKATALGITSAIFFGYMIALLSKSRDKT